MKVARLLEAETDAVIACFARYRAVLLAGDVLITSCEKRKVFDDPKVTSSAALRRPVDFEDTPW